MLIFGDPKIGKSFAGIQLACCLATGTRWLGFDIPKPKPVAYVQLDTPRSLWAARVQDLRDSGHSIEKVHFADMDTLDTHPFNILDPAHFKLLSENLATINPGAVIIDTFREAHRGDENDSTEMQNVVAHLDAAVKPAAMILVSHARKSNPEYGYDLLNDNRGSNYIVGRMDAICRFSKASMRVTSRTLEEQSVKLERLDDGTWELARDPWVAIAETLFDENPLMPERELSRLIHDADGSRSESACRSWVRRERAKIKLRK